MDHPDIANALRTGYPNGEPETPTCPVCGKECEDVYLDSNHVIFGCDRCVKVRSAWDHDECF